MGGSRWQSHAGCVSHGRRLHLDGEFARLLGSATVVHLDILDAVVLDRAVSGGHSAVAAIHQTGSRNFRHDNRRTLHRIQLDFDARLDAGLARSRRFHRRRRHFHRRLA